LRQCMIALRLAERIGLDDEQRSVVYYTALLVNVGCHSDAHEQAKWFGDDIALKSGKYDHELRSLRAAATLGGKRNVLKRFERTELLKKRGQWKEGDRITGLRKTKPEA